MQIVSYQTIMSFVAIVQDWNSSIYLYKTKMTFIDRRMI